MKKRTIIILLILSTFILVSCKKPENNNLANTQNVETNKPQDQYDTLGFNKFDFSATALDSIEYNTKIFENSKVTLINFWGTFCGPCKAELPELAEISKKYDPKDLQVIGIIIDTFEGSNTNIDTAKEILKENNIAYLNLIPNEMMYDKYLKNNIQAVPTTIFVDKDGNVIGNVLMGAKTEDTFSQIIDELIKSQK